MLESRPKCRERVDFFSRHNSTTVAKVIACGLARTSNISETGNVRRRRAHSHRVCLHVFERRRQFQSRLLLLHICRVSVSLCVAAIIRFVSVCICVMLNEWSARDARTHARAETTLYCCSQERIILAETRFHKME